jgi:hypothetical protein
MPTKIKYPNGIKPQDHHCSVLGLIAERQAIANLSVFCVRRVMFRSDDVSYDGLSISKMDAGSNSRR